MKITQEDIQKTIPRTREMAKILGMPTYYTGKPCKYGHMATRKTVSAHCTECLKAKHNEKEKDRCKERYEKNHEEQIKRAKLINTPSSLAAINKRLPWSWREKDVMNRRNKEGNYLLSDVRLAEILGRSIMSIRVERSRSK